MEDKEIRKIKKTPPESSPNIPPSKVYKQGTIGEIIDVPMGGFLSKPPKLVVKGKRKTWVKPKQKKYDPKYAKIDEEEALRDYEGVPRFDEYGDEIMDEEDYNEPEEDLHVRLPEENVGEDAEMGLEMIGDEMIETQIDWIEKKVPRFKKGTALYEVAKRYGREKETTIKLVPIKIREKVREARTKYTHTIKLQVGPLGTLLPYKTGRKIKIIGETESLPINHSPLYKFSPRIPQPPESYTGSLRFGDKISFVHSQITKIKGVILDLSKSKLKLLEVPSIKKINVPYSDIKNVQPTTLDVTQKGNIVHVGSRRFLLGKDSRRWGDQMEHNLDIGGSVEISIEKSNVITGIILEFDPSNFVIASSEGKKYDVAYDDPTIKIHPRKEKTKVTKKVKIPDVYNILPRQVDNNFREIMVDKLFRVFSEVIDGLTDKNVQVSQEYTPSVTAIKPWGEATIEWKDNSESDTLMGMKGEWIVSWDFEGREISRSFPVPHYMDKDSAKPTEFAETGYYAENFISWFYSKMYPSLLEKLPISSIEEQVNSEIEEQSDPQYLIRRLMNKYGDDIFQNDAANLKNRMNENKRGEGVDIMDVSIRTSLERLSYERLINLKGLELAKFLSRVISDTMKEYPSDKDQIRSRLQSEWILSEFNKISPTEEDRDEFEKEALPTLRKNYREYLKDYEKSLEIDKIHRKQRTESDKKRREFEENVGELRKRRKINIPNHLTEKGYKVYLEIEKFERDCYAMSDEGITVLDYLLNVCMPMTYLDTELRNYAKFFEAKIISGEIHISALYAANLPYYFPELAMNFNTLSEKEWDKALGEISRLILKKVYESVELYIRILNPGMQRRSQDEYSAVFDWSKYITTVQNKCEKDTQTGKTYKRNREGDIIYREEVKYGKKHKIPEVEDKSLADIVICYDKESNKFTCHSLDEVLLDIRRSENKKIINPFTGQIYPSNFINKLRERYPERIQNIRTPKRVEEPEEDISEHHTEVDSLFSSSEEDEQEINEKEEPESLEELEMNLSEDKLNVVYFYAEWCVPCQKFSSEWDDIVESYPGVNFIKVDKDIADEIVDHYDVKKIPGFLFLRIKDDKIKKLSLIAGSSRKLIDANIKKYTKK